MNKKIRVIALVLAASMLLSLSACKINVGVHGKVSVSSEEATGSETTTEVTTTSATTTTTATEETTEETVYPEKGCKIEFKPQDKRYHYDMDLTLNADKNTVGGHVEFSFFNDTDKDWDKLCLRDYSSLYKFPKKVGYDSAVKTHGEITDIKNIKDGRTGSEIRMERDEDVSVVWLPLASKLAPGEKMTLSYDFVATVPTVADRYGVQDGVYNVTNFYPILAEYTDDGWSHEAFYSTGECFFSEISDYDVRLTVPEKMTVLSTGLETGENASSGSKTITIHADCVRDFVFCASKDFKILEGDYKDTHIRVAYTEEDNPKFYKKCAEESLRVAKESLEAFGSAFGEYPYKDLEVVLAPIAAGGMEYPNLVIISKEIPMGLPDSELDNYAVNMAESVVSHEVGHQWFMGIVGSNSGLQPWLDESFASYTERVYENFKDPGILGGSTYIVEENYDYSGMHNHSGSDEENPYVPINRSFYEFPDEWSFVMGVYTHGQAVLSMMQSAVGYDNFLGIIREYVQNNAFRNADQMDFFDVLYKHAGVHNKKLNQIIADNFDEKVQPPEA